MAALGWDAYDIDWTGPTSRGEPVAYTLIYEAVEEIAKTIKRICFPITLPHHQHQHDPPRAHIETSRRQRAPRVKGTRQALKTQ